MNLEGLELILSKKEVVPTVSAEDLRDRASQVDADYKRHVRTYVPISRAAEGDGEGLSVVDFERRVIRAIKEAKAPRGYVTAEYGYGKTSTALYLWDRAEQENLLAVPPFQLLELPDLVTATYGWVRFRLEHSRPEFISTLDGLYDATINRSLEALANRHGIGIPELEVLSREGRLRIELQPTDYIQYFEKVTEIVLQAGFDGLLILPDEIQQYIEPALKERSKDPIAPFFNLVQGLATRQGHLCFGFIMIIPKKEIGVIREAKGRDDLLHRMKDLSLDLTNVYDSDFPTRLWELLSEQFQFADRRWDIVRPETLDALGQIVSRDDLSNGPRTVINVFKRMIQRFLTAEDGQRTAYSPIDLVRDFLDGHAIQFAGDNRIQSVVRDALGNALVRNDLERYERAILLAAAFPNEGVNKDMQRAYGVDSALQDLMNRAIGELVMAVGPIDRGGITLSRLDRSPISTEWLPQTIRDFRRGFGEDHDVTTGRVLDMFVHLLKSQVFRETNWKLVQEVAGNRVQNRSLVFEGAAQSLAAEFPKRRVRARILWENEAWKDQPDEQDDVVIEYRLLRHLDDPDRRHISHSLKFNEERWTAEIFLNLAYVREGGAPLQLQQQFQNVWSPYDLSPLILMSIYALLEEKRSQKLIPKAEDQGIQFALQPAMMEAVVRDLFNAKVGAPVGAAGASITEQAIGELLRRKYGDTYHTLMAVTSWGSSLVKYKNALSKLETVYQRRGDVDVMGTKDDIASRLFTLTNVSLDSFLKNFGELLKVVKPWAGKDEGAIRFTLHPLEREILSWLRESKRTERVEGEIVHALQEWEAYGRARKLGYKEDEVAEVIELLIARDLIDKTKGNLLREIPSRLPDVESLAEEIRNVEAALQALRQGFPEHEALSAVESDLGRIRQLADDQRRTGAPDPQKIDTAGRAVRKCSQALVRFADDRQREILQAATKDSQLLRPIKEDRILQLAKPFEGSVNYVEQVNQLRVQFHKNGQKLRAEVIDLNQEQDKVLNELRVPGLGFETLVRLAAGVKTNETRLQQVNNKVAEFEADQQYLDSWRDLITNGSSLLEQVQQMEHAAQEELADFTRLSTDIRSEITTKANRLDALPNCSPYAHRLGNIQVRVRNKRSTLEGEFISQQNRYRTLFSTHLGVPSDKLWKIRSFNVSNPAESYSLVYEAVQDVMRELTARLRNQLVSFRERANAATHSPLKRDLAPEQQAEVEQRSADLISQIEQASRELSELMRLVEDSTVVTDLPSQDQGAFFGLVSQTRELLTHVKVLSGSVDELTRWLAEIELSPHEESVLAALKLEDLERELDIGDWLTSAKLNDMEFWAIVRSLYQKQRVRVRVSRVRR